jgi:hypothetical protein
MIFVPWPLVCLVGRGFFRLVQSVPLVFPALMMLGSGICIWIGVAFDDPNPLKHWILKFIGVGGSLFYSGLLVMFFVKWRQNTWNEFCEWVYCIFDSD